MQKPYFLQSKDLQSENLYSQIYILYYQNLLLKEIFDINKKQEEIKNKKNQKWTGLFQTIKFTLIGSEKFLSETKANIKEILKSLYIQENYMEEHKFNDFLYNGVLQRSLNIIEKHIQDKNLSFDFYVPDPVFVRDYLKEIGFSGALLEKYDDALYDNIIDLFKKSEIDFPKKKSLLQITSEPIGAGLRFGLPFVGASAASIYYLYGSDYATAAKNFITSSTVGLVSTTILSAQLLFKSFAKEKTKENVSQIFKKFYSWIYNDLKIEKQLKIIRSVKSSIEKRQKPEGAYLDLHKNRILTQYSEYIMRKDNLVKLLEDLMPQYKVASKIKKQNNSNSRKFKAK